MVIFNLIMIMFAIYTFAIASGIVAEKSGQVNIAINGMMLFGALFGVFGYIIVHRYGPDTLGNVGCDFFAIICGAIGGILSSFLLSIATLKFKADGGVAGTTINILAPVILLFLAQGNVFKGKPFISQQNGFIVNVTMVDGFNYSYFIWALLAIFVVFILYVFFRKTKWGTRMCGVGNNPMALEIVGVNVIKYRFFATCISGALAGVGGVLVVIMNSGAIINSIGGVGFIALCMVAISMWKIEYSVIVALVVGILFSLASYYSLRSATIPKEVFWIIPFILPLFILPFFMKKSNAPKALGKIYQKGKR